MLCSLLKYDNELRQLQQIPMCYLLESPGPLGNHVISIWPIISEDEEGQWGLSG